MIKQLGVLSLLLIVTNGKSVYDQRQDGRFNFHAQLDNIMIVIATPGDKGPSSLFNDIASQILELRGLTSRNKKVSVADEEIVEEGKDPLNVKILRIEENAAEESRINHENPAQFTKNFAESQSKIFETPKIQDFKFHVNENQFQKEEISKIAEKKTSSENQQILEKLGISEKIHLHNSEKSHVKEIKNLKTSDEIKSEKIESPEKDLSKEQTPQKLISFGTISSVDGKVIYISEKKHSDSLEENTGKKDNQKIHSSKSIGQNSASEEIDNKDEIIKIKERIEEISKVDEEKIKLDQILPKKLEDQSKNPEIHGSVVSNEKKIETPTEGKITRKSRFGRELQDSFKEPIHQKSRMSLKKELPRVGDLKDEEAGEKNEVRLIADRKSQLKPIGEMLENCGPGRIRNRYGICQFDESFN